MNETALTKYDVARQALAAARSVDEVLDVRDKAEQFRLYARQAQDRDLLADATEIHMRAERRLGEMLIEVKQDGQLRSGRPKTETPDNSRDPRPLSRIVLKDAGISRDLSARSQKCASISTRAFEAMVARTREKIVAGAATIVNPMKDLSKAEKQERRANHERVLGAMQMSLPNKRYGVILADPEWRFEVWGENGLDRAPDNHYPTSPIEAIKARPVQDIAARDCVLFLWATVPILAHALDVMAAWGFQYKSHFAWVKEREGTGYWSRNLHELLLIGVRGNVPAPAPGTQWPSAITAPAGRHSEKPDQFYALIEAYFPTLPKIELNARRLRAGWDAWGNEVVTDAA